MKIILLFVIVHFSTISFSQDTLMIAKKMNDIEKQNIASSQLANGFYYLRTIYRSQRKVIRYVIDSTPSGYNYKIKKKGFGFFKKEVKIDSFPYYARREIKVDTTYDFDREYGNTKYHIYNVIPKPIALKENIIRIHHSQKKIKDSLLINGLAFKLTYFDNDTLCNESNRRRNCNDIGIIINNKLVCAVDPSKYYLNKNSDKKSKTENLIMFYNNSTKEEIEYIYKQLKPNPYMKTK